MKKQPWLYSATLFSALAAAVLLSCSMLAIPFLKEQIFVERGTIDTAGEFLVLLAFAQYAVFTVISICWLLSCLRQGRQSRKAAYGLLSFGVLCLFLLTGIKQMVDEIAREYGMGWDVGAEWAILYVFLSLQLLYIFTILRRLFRRRSSLRDIDRHFLGKV